MVATELTDASYDQVQVERGSGGDYETMFCHVVLPRDTSVHQDGDFHRINLVQSGHNPGGNTCQHSDALDLQVHSLRRSQLCQAESLWHRSAADVGAARQPILCQPDPGHGGQCHQPDPERVFQPRRHYPVGCGGPRRQSRGTASVVRQPWYCAATGAMFRTLSRQGRRRSFSAVGVAISCHGTALTHRGAWSSQNHLPLRARASEAPH